MNLFKSFSSIFFILSLLITPASSFAVEATPITANKASLVGTVNLQDARIISQKGNTFNIAFSLSNREGLQAGVKYGVQLILDGAKYIADEKVYDESFTLYENDTVKREIVYTAPSNFSGDYNLVLASNNESGFPFGAVSLGKVKLTATTKGVQISNDSCYLQVEGEKGSPHYPLTRSLDISASESLKLNCSAINNTGTGVSMTPYFETRYFNAYGKISPQTGGDYTAISFAKDERKNISIALPKSNASQFYNLKFALMNASTSSNTISVYYIIRGVNGIIQKISLDKDYYKFGDKGEMSIIWSASAGNFARSGLKAGSVPSPVVSLKATVTGKNGVACISPIEQTLTRTPNSPQTILSFNTKATCLNPKVSAILSDKDGNVLDQKDFTFTSSGDHASLPLGTMQMLLIALALVVIIVVGIIMRKKKNVTIQQ